MGLSESRINEIIQIIQETPTENLSGCDLFKAFCQEMKVTIADTFDKEFLEKLKEIGETTVQEVVVSGCMCNTQCAVCMEPLVESLINGDGEEQSVVFYNNGSSKNVYQGYHTECLKKVTNGKDPTTRISLSKITPYTVLEPPYVYCQEYNSFTDFMRISPSSGYNPSSSSSISSSSSSSSNIQRNLDIPVSLGSQRNPRNLGSQRNTFSLRMLRNRRFNEGGSKKRRKINNKKKKSSSKKKKSSIKKNK